MGMKKIVLLLVLALIMGVLPVSAVSGSIVDDCSSFSKLYEYEPNLKLGNSTTAPSNPGYFVLAPGYNHMFQTGQTVASNPATAGYVVYKAEGAITSFSFHMAFYAGHFVTGTVANESFKVYVSPDGTNYTEIIRNFGFNVEWPAIVGGTGGASYIMYRSIPSGIPANTKYLKVLFPTANTLNPGIYMYGMNIDYTIDLPDVSMDNSNDVAIDMPLTLKFTNEMDTAAIIPADFSLSGGISITAVNLEADKKTLKLTTSENLLSLTDYTLTLSGNIKDIYDQSIPENKRIISFRTEKPLKINSFSFKKGSNISVIESGTIECVADILNASMDNPSVTMMVLLYNKAKLCDISYKKMTITKGTNDTCTLSVNVPASFDLNDSVIKVYFMDDIRSMNAFDIVYELKK